MPAAFEGLRQRLLEAGVAPPRVGRYLGELDDHLADLVAAALSTGTSAGEAHASALRRMGSIDALAQAMLVRPEFRSWLARVPWLILPAGALLALAAGYILSLLSLVGAVRGFGIVTEGHVMPPGWLPGPAESLFGFDHIVLPVLIGWGVAFAAFRQRLRLVWPLVGMIAVAAIGSGLVVTADWPATPRHWEVSLGTPLLDPSLAMSWAEYARSVLIVLMFMVLPPGIALRLRRRAALV